MNWENVITTILASIMAITVLAVFIMIWLDEIKALFKRKPKYRIGQKVRVRGDLIKHKEYGGRTVYLSMLKHVGNVVTINDVNPAGNVYYYGIKEDWEDAWTAEMFNNTHAITKDNAFENLLHGHINDEEYSEIMNGGDVVNYVRSWRKNRTHRRSK